jgi:polysaccharide export outer membrane protein
MNTIKLLFNRLPILLFLFVFFSCTPTKKLTYVANKGPDAANNEYFNDRSEKTIQPYDYLYIKIFSLDERTNNIFNERSSSSNETELLSYAVDDKGNVNMPFIGTINVKDLTINQAKERIEKSLAIYLNNISVTVRFVSNKITVLGEVNVPGLYAFYDEKVTAFQAIGFARGTTTFGDLTNITLIREKNNKVSYYYLDMTKKNIVGSDNYYLLPNDIIIINPIKAKYRDLRDYALNLTDALLSTIASILTIILVTTNLTK